MNREVVFMKRKSVKYAFYGFFAGLGVTLVCLLLIFLALGAVGVTSPMLPVIAGIFMPAGTAIGYKIGLEGNELSMYPPIAAYIAGTLTFIILNILYSARSFYLGGLVFVAVLFALFFYTLPSKDSIKQYEGIKQKVFRNYLVVGLLTAAAAGVFTWNLIAFTVCAIIVLLASITVYYRLKPAKPVLRKKESLSHTLEITPPEKVPLPPKKRSLFFIPAALVFFIFGAAGYFAYPMLNNIYTFSLSLALASLISLYFGRLLCRRKERC
jgi:hypothetical protein